MLSEEGYHQLSFLARLDADDPALCAAYTEFNTILDYINKIQELDTQAETPSQKIATDPHAPPPLYTREREDVPQTIVITPQEVAQFAPQWEAGHFVVPGAIEGEG